MVSCRRAYGRLVYTSESRTELPCVGDWVGVQYHDSETTRASITSCREVVPETKKSRERYRIPDDCANIDVAFIVQSCHYDFNVRRLERYLVIASEGHIEPVILLTKTDLISPKFLEQLVNRFARQT